MDFNNLSFDELDEHVMEHLIFDDEEMSPILKGHIFIEKILETAISNNLENPFAFFNKNRSYDMKVDLAYAMGILDEKYYSSFKAINKIRNSYAHKHDYKVSIQELSALKFDWEDIQKRAFDVACTKGASEAARIAIIFLSWKAIHLIKEPKCLTTTITT